MTAVGGELPTGRVADRAAPVRLCVVLLRTVILGLLLAGSAAGETSRSESLRINRTVEPRFPDALIRRGIYEGEVRVVLLVDAEGRLADWLLTSFSHPLLAREATEALRQWRFEPARRYGEPVDVRTELVLAFQASGMVVSMSPLETAVRFEHRGGEDSPQRLVARPAELDAPLTPIRRVAPLATEWSTEGREASVTLDFYIDREGRPRMPGVLRSDDDALNAAAIDALSHWRFEPPMSGGVPVIVRATQVFRFHRRT